MSAAPASWVDDVPSVGAPISSRPTAADALGERIFRQLAEDRFRLDAADVGLSLELDRVRRNVQGALVGELIVSSDLAGVMT